MINFFLNDHVGLGLRYPWPNKKEISDFALERTTVYPY